MVCFVCTVCLFGLFFGLLSGVLPLTAVTHVWLKVFMITEQQCHNFIVVLILSNVIEDDCYTFLANIIISFLN